MKPKIPEYLFGHKVEGSLERVLKKQPPKQIILSSDDFWTISNVGYRNKTESYDLSKTLLPAMNQGDASKYSQDNFHTPDMPLYHAIFKSLYDQRNAPESETARKFLQEEMRIKW